MKSSEFWITMSDGYESYIYKWEPDEKENVKGIFQIIHGSAEHSRRYNEFAEFLTENNYIVYSNDLRGHGFSAKDKETLGYFADEKGWERLVEDIHELTLFIKENHEGQKPILLGHSMGSFLARHYAILFGNEVRGVIATGTAHNPKPILLFGRFLANIDIKKNGHKHKNELLNKMSYDSFNSNFKPARTNKDWLTRDEKIVDEYINDELCGYVFTASGFRDMFEGLMFITSPQNIKRTPKKLPMLLLSGEKDPVGGDGRMVHKAFQQYKMAGIQNIKMKLYKEMRHEILNEVGREEVYEDILKWASTV